MFQRPPRRNIVEPALAALIDVFSILIIFLIAGTVLGNSSIELPQGLIPPKSVSRESMLTAPQVTVHEGSVRLSFAQQSFSLGAFIANASTDVAVLESFKNQIRGFLAQNKGRADFDMLNFVADRELTYDRIFPVIKAAREAGVRSILFVSLVDAKHD